MKRVLSLLVAAVGIAFATPAYSQTFLVDFGNNGTNGNITASPDTNGNYWNNSYNGGYTVTNLVSTSGSSTSIRLAYTTSVATNSASLGVAGAPAPFNISTAYEDAIFSTGTTAATGITFRVSQLDPTKTYVFTLFGSRAATDNRTTNFLISGATTDFGTLQTSGANLGGTGVNYNNSNTLTLGGATGLSPITVSGTSYIDVTLYATAADTNKFAYLNAMQILVVPEPTSIALLGAAGASAFLLRRRNRTI